MKLRIVKNCKYSKSWKSNLGYIVRQAFKRGVLLPLTLEFGTYEDLEASYLSVKNSSYEDDIRIARMYQDVYNYGEICILDDNFGNCTTCDVKGKCTDTCLHWQKIHNLFEEV